MNYRFQYLNPTSDDLSQPAYGAFGRAWPIHNPTDYEEGAWGFEPENEPGAAYYVDPEHLEFAPTPEEAAKLAEEEARLDMQDAAFMDSPEEGRAYDPSLESGTPEHDAVLAQERMEDWHAGKAREFGD